jgi:hypothetical protein
MADFHGRIVFACSNPMAVAGQIATKAHEKL